LSNLQSLHAFNFIYRKNGSCAWEKVLLLGNLEDAPLLLENLALALIEPTSIKVVGRRSDYW
jgi:hypothetical protein